jgi:hypothetical protein
MLAVLGDHPGSQAHRPERNVPTPKMQCAKIHRCGVAFRAMFRAAIPVVAVAVLASCANAGSAGSDSGTGAIDGRRVVDAAMPDATSSGCTNAITCTTAMMLGSVSGDTGSNRLNAMGHQAAWFRVRVTENNDSFSGLTTRVAAKLTSPSAVNFDVFVYLNAGADQPECAAMAGTSTTNGNVNETRAEWGEGAVANGLDDSRDVSIEVRPISGACSPSQTWQLEVEGNWI